MVYTIQTLNILIKLAYTIYMPTVKCKQCSSGFYVKPSHQKLGYGIYCSTKCRGEGSRTGQTVNCSMCNKAVWKTPRDFHRSKSEKLFCSKSCQTKWRNEFFSGENHANWQGGEYIYKDVLIRSGQATICKKCGNADERVLEVHHIDKDRKNSKLENLVWLCGNCHTLVHRYNESW